MSIEHDDFLALEDLFIARIEGANIDGLKKIYGSKDLATVTGKNHVTPSLAIVYDSYKVSSVSNRGCKAIIVQKWFTVLSVRSARDQKNGSGLREISGPMMMKVIRALHGWKPGAGFGTTVLVSAPRAKTTATEGDYPLGWNTEFYI